MKSQKGQREKKFIFCFSGKCRPSSSFVISLGATKVTYTLHSDVRCVTTEKRSRSGYPQRTGEHKYSQGIGCDHGQTTGHLSRKALLHCLTGIEKVEGNQ